MSYAHELKILITIQTTLAFSSNAFATDPPLPSPLSPGWIHGATVVGPQCRPLTLAACLECVETECMAAAAAIGDPVGFTFSCEWAAGLQCPDDDDRPPPEPIMTPPDPISIDIPEISPTLAFLTATVLAGGYVIIRYPPRLPTAGGPGVAIAGVIIGAPILLGATAGEAFANYVDNYDIGINNSVTGTGPTGTGQCPPGEESVTYAYGTACRPSYTPPPPPPPACSSIRTCDAIQAENGGIIVPPEDGAFACAATNDGPHLSTVQIACVENGVLTSREGCLELKCARADTLDP